MDDRESLHLSHIDNVRLKIMVYNAKPLLGVSNTSNGDEYHIVWQAKEKGCAIAYDDEKRAFVWCIKLD